MRRRLWLHSSTILTQQATTKRRGTGMLLKVIRPSFAPAARAAATKPAKGSAKAPGAAAPPRKKMKSVRSMLSHQSEGRGKVPSRMGITRGTFIRLSVSQVSVTSKPKLFRRWSRLYLAKPLSSTKPFTKRSAEWDVNFLPPEPASWFLRTGCTALHSSSLLGMMLGWRIKPMRALSQSSLTSAATRATVRPKTRRSTGRGPSSSISKTCARNTVALPKNSASEHAMTTICMRSDLDSSTSLPIQESIRASVSPPLGRKRILPRDTLALAFTKLFHRSSVQMVTNQPRSSAMPRARATKGCTSPLVPRVIMNTWKG
mmetsp:Transcript_106860/g.297531  ORF Transcript_106860/g.297531 Transcript_106860/m.297531 type:complete len:316 (-) Transcript_106860:930-1877(-)